MFPNPHDALPLPPRPDLDQYRKQAKDLVRACRTGEVDGIGQWAAKWVETLATLQGQAITTQLRAQMLRSVNEVEQFARRMLLSSDAGKAKCALAGAQFVIARLHGFTSWPKFARHIEGLAHASSPVSKFEAAAQAIVSGDVATLKRLLDENRQLIRARSTREHRATLLHYVSANGVEGYRQRTPKNALKVAEILLRAGAEVDAEAEVYGGGATALGLAATSMHTEQAGVQGWLIEILLEYGATIDHPVAAGNRQYIVNACLANGRGKAAEFLAKRGAQLDLEGAAGVGRLDAVKSFFNDDGSLKANVTKAQMERGFMWACEYGRNNVVDFLLRKGVDLLAQADTGQTGLHWAVIGEQPETIRLLLERGASLETLNSYGGTALEQALWCAINSDLRIDYVPTIETLLDAGARIADRSLAWLAEQGGPRASVKARVADVLRRHGAKS